MGWIVRGRSWTTIATACAVVGAVVSIVVSHARAPTAERLGPASFPNVPLITQDGTTVRFYDDLLKGKAVAIDLIYTDCTDECPLETARMVQVQRLLSDHVGKDLFFYSISIDPVHDTPEVLKDYADKFHVGPGWLFLTGKEGDIQQIARKLGMSYSKNNLASQDAHGTTLMLGDEPTGQWMQNSAEDNPRFLASTISTFMGWRSDTPETSYAEARPLAIDRGGYVFRTRCVGCHTIGQGDEVGPDLAGVTDRRDGAWLARYLAAPDQVLAAGDPIAAALYAKYRQIPMPNLKLDSGDVAALVSYLDAQSHSTGVANVSTNVAP
jgi:protein SCO1